MHILMCANSRTLGVSRKLRSHCSLRLHINFSFLPEKFELLQPEKQINSNQCKDREVNVSGSCMPPPPQIFFFPNLVRKSTGDKVGLTKHIWDWHRKTSEIFYGYGQAVFENPGTARTKTSRLLPAKMLATIHSVHINPFPSGE